MADKIIFEVVATAKGVKLVQQQTDKLAKSTDKAATSTDKLGKSRDRYNRKEKGAAQISSNSTKNFSKMQQGIDGGGGSGGLVRAYALLAANVFALTAAFGVLSRSAQIDTLTQSMEVLSTSGGTYIKNLAKDMQAASGFAIDLAQAFSQVSLASSAGLNTKEIEGLTAVAKGAAISLGRNLPDAMDRIFRGAIKLEPEILDEIGLFVRVDEAAQKYARNSGKVVSALTQVEKRQAFLNEILEQGTKKFSEYAENIKPDPYVRIGAALGDVAQSALSLMNGFLGPLLGFLAESKTLLTAVFGTLVAVLLKKAIPAMGLMTKGAAEQASERAAAAKAYSKSISENSDKAIAADLKTAKSAKKALKDRAQTEKRFVSRSTKKGADLDGSKLAKMNMGTEKRRIAVEERITMLKKAQNDSDSKNQVLIRAELEMLEEEENIERRIAGLKSKSGVTGGSLADRKQQKLDSKERVSTVVAGAAGTMETKGVSAGWKELNKELKTTVDVNGKMEKKFSLTERSMARMKGGVSALGVGFNKLMMMMGPAMMIFALLSPFLIAGAKAMGFMNDESKKLSESIKKLSDQLETLEKRFDAQIVGMKSQGITYVENIKANLAFNRGLLDTVTRTQDVIKAFKEWEKSADWFPTFIEKMLKSQGFGKELKTMEIASESLKTSILGLINAGGMERDFAAEVLGITPEAAKDIGDIDNASASLHRSALKLSEGQLKLGSGYSSSVESLLNYAKAGLTVAETEKRLMRELDDVEHAFFLQAKSGAVASKTLEDIGTNAKLSDKQLKQLSVRAKEQTRIFANLSSALQGGAEAMGKFTSQFLPKTKVDDVVASLGAMQASLDEMTDPSKRQAFFDSFGDIDNPFSGIFDEMMKEEPAADFIGPVLDKTVLSEKVFKRVLVFFKEFQAGVLQVASATKKLTDESKRLNKFIDAGATIREKIDAKETQIRKNNARIADDTFKVIGRGFKQGEKDLRTTVKDNMMKLETLSLLEDGEEKTKVMKEFETDLLNIGLSRTKLLKLDAALNATLTAELEKGMFIYTKTERLAIQRLKTEQEIQKAQLAKGKALAEEVTLTTKIKALESRGTLTLSAREEADIAVKTAILKFKTTVAEATMKKAMITAETNLLRQQMIFYAKQTGDTASLNKDGTGLNDILEKNLTSAATTMEQAYTQIIRNASDVLTLDLAQAVSSGFESGVYGGIVAAQTAVKERRIEERANMTPEELAQDKEDNPILTKRDDISSQEFRGTSEKMAEDMKKLGPQGELVAAVVQGAFAISDAYADMQAVMSLSLKEGGTGMAKAAATAEFAAQAIGQIGKMMAANSNAQIAEVDKQIAAEKKRDGKSTESVAKLAAMEKKKEAMKRKAFEQDKKMQMARVVASTAAGIMGVISGVKSFWDAPIAIATAAMIGAMGAAQLAIISKTSYSGGGGDVDKPKMTALTIGKRDNKVDVSRGPSGGEMNYLRGGRGVGSNANDFRPAGGAYGMKSYAAKGEGILVGEQGPEVVTPTQPVDVLAASSGGGEQNINFTINTIDSQGVEEFLSTNQGAIIGTIRGAANGYGEGFLEEVDTDVVSAGPYTKG